MSAIYLNNCATTKAEPDKIYFTSRGTGSDNLAIKGPCLANAKHGNHIVTTVTEHAAVTKTIRDLKRMEWTITYISAPNGELDMEELEFAINEDAVLVSAMPCRNHWDRGTGSLSQ